MTESPELTFKECLKWVKQGRENAERKLGLPIGSTGNEKSDAVTKRILEFIENDPNPGKLSE